MLGHIVFDQFVAGVLLTNKMVNCYGEESFEKYMLDQNLNEIGYRFQLKGVQLVCQYFIQVVLISTHNRNLLRNGCTESLGETNGV